MSILHKRLRWGVIGAPSSGKTYLLSDLIQAFDLMGFKQEPLPLTAPYNSFGAFFAETSGANGSMPQTERYACRRENHYGAIFEHPTRSLPVEVDFLNLPGETFRDASRISLFSTLRNRISSISNPVFVIETYVNPAGRERYVLRHANTRPLEDKSVSELPRSMRHINYLERQFIYAELRGDGYSLSKSTPVNGRQLMKRFFDIEADSFYDTLVAGWQYLFPDLSLSEYKAKNVLLNFYPLMYCTQATDLILCDKMFKPSTADDRGDNYDFGSLVKNVSGFVQDVRDHRPNAYLAFRGADFMLHGCEERFRTFLSSLPADVSPFRKRHDAYTLFCLSLLSQLYGQSYATDASYPDLAGFADPDGGGSDTLTDMDLATHLGTRFGHSMGNGFWHLLGATERTGLSRLLDGLAHSLLTGRKDRSVMNIYNDQKRPKMPPHVYFTATPIDEHFCIYRNDPDDVSRFIHESSDKIRAFHIETASQSVRSMCWGSFQLLDDILDRNGIPSPAAKHATPLLMYFKGQ